MDIVDKAQELEAIAYENYLDGVFRPKHSSSGKELSEKEKQEAALQRKQFLLEAHVLNIVNERTRISQKRLIAEAESRRAANQKAAAIEAAKERARRKVRLLWRDKLRECRQQQEPDIISVTGDIARSLITLVGNIVQRIIRL